MLVLLGTFQVLTISRKSFKLMSPMLLWCVQFFLLLSRENTFPLSYVVVSYPPSYRWSKDHRVLVLNRNGR